MNFIFLKGGSRILTILQFEKVGQKQWTLSFPNGGTFELKMTPSSVTNKFEIITDFITGISEHIGEPFNDWLEKLLTEGSDPSKRSEVLFNNIASLKNFVDEYLIFTNVDYTQFVDESKAKKNSILFKADEIEMILKLSSYLKVYSIFSNTENLKLGKRFHQEIYNKIAADISDTEIVAKIFKVIQTKTFRYKQSDSFMWEYIKTIQCKDIGTHIIEIFNFIMNNILILCQHTKNPITYFVGVVDESVKWFLRSVYKGSIVYDDSVSTEDIHGSERDNLLTYSFNDTLGRLKNIAFDKIYEQLERDNTSLDHSDKYITDFHDRVKDIEFISPLSQCLVFPILSTITKIPYAHFKTISPEHTAILSYYTDTIFQKVFKADYRNLFSLLHYFPTSNPAIGTTYRVKNIHDYLNIQNNTKDFFGFNTKTLPHIILCHYVGRVSRVNFKHLLSGQVLSGIPLSKVESDMIVFYAKYFSGELNTQLSEMVALMNADF